MVYVCSSSVTLRMINGILNSVFWLVFLLPGVVCILASNKFTCTTVSFGVVFFLCRSFAYQMEVCLVVFFFMLSNYFYSFSSQNSNLKFS